MNIFEVVSKFTYKIPNEEREHKFTSRLILPKTKLRTAFQMCPVKYLLFVLSVEGMLCAEEEAVMLEKDS